MSCENTLLIHVQEAQMQRSSHVLNIFIVVKYNERINLQNQFDEYFWKIIVK